MTLCPIHDKQLSLIDGIWQCPQCIERRRIHLDLELRRTEKIIAKIQEQMYPNTMFLNGERIKYTTLLDDEAKELLLKTGVDLEKSL